MPHQQSKLVKITRRIKEKSASRIFGLAIRKTNQHIHAFVYNKETGNQVFSISTQIFKKENPNKNLRNKAFAKSLGVIVAQKCKEKEISEVFFDKGVHKYHGILAEVCASATQAGLVI